MKFLICVSFVLLVVSCNYHVDKTAQAAQPPASEDQPKKLVFDDVSKSVFAASCVRCHGGATPKAGYSLETRDQAIAKHVVAGDSEKSTLCGALLDGYMPPAGPLDEKLVEMVCDWIDQGAL